MSTSDSNLPPTGYLILPCTGMDNPSTGFFFGSVGSYTFRFKATDRYFSLINGTATYSTKKQGLRS
jgi:hypothetical protein